MSKVITNRRQTEKLRSFLIKRERGNINITNITIAGDEVHPEVGLGILSIPANLETHALKVRTYNVMTSKTTAREVDNFCKDLLNINIVTSKHLHLVAGTIYRTGSGKRERFYTDASFGKVFDLMAFKEVPMSRIFNDDGKLKKDVRTYGGAGGGASSSPSQLRKKNVTLACNNLPESIRERWNEATFGALVQAEGKEMTFPELVTACARMSQFRAPGTFYNEQIKNFAVYMGKFEFDGNEFCDGSMLMSDAYVARAFSAKDPARYEFTHDAVRGLVLQCRPWLCKVMAKVVEPAYIRGFIGANMWQVVHIARDSITQKMQEEFNKALKKQPSIYSGKVVVITDTLADNYADYEAMTDLNGLKHTFDLTRPSGLNLLDIGNAMSCEKGSRLSSQMVTTLFAADTVKATEFVLKRGTQEIKERFSQVSEMKPRIPSLADVKSMYVEGVIPKIAPVFATENHCKLYRNTITNLLNGLKRDIKLMAFPLDGITAKILPDLATDFRTQILGMTEDGKMEAYCPAAEKYFSNLALPENEWLVTGYKFPKIHIREYAQIRVVPFAEIVRRIKQSSIFAKNKELLKRAYKSLTAAAIVVPTIGTIKNMLAGMDFDADAMAVVFDVEYNSIIMNSQVDPMAVVITAPEAQTTKQPKKYSINAGWDVFVKTVLNDNKSIGEVTIINCIFIELYNQVRAGHLNDAKMILSEEFLGRHNEEVYISPLQIVTGERGIPVQHIDVNLMHEVTERIKGMQLTQENMIIALNDLSTVMRMVQELTIDSAKTSVCIDMPFDMSKYKLCHREKIDFRINWSGKEVVPPKAFQTHDKVFYQQSPKSGWHEIKYASGPVKKYYIDDTFNIIMKQLEQVLLEELKFASEKEQDFTPQQKQRFDQATAMSSKYVGTDLKHIKKMYDDLVAIHQKELEACNGDEEMYIAKEMHKKMLLEVSNMVRRITAELDHVQRSMVLCKQSSRTNFSINVCKEEFLLMVAQNYAEIDFAGERLDSCSFATGEKVEFTAGIAEYDGKLAVCKEAIDGIFVIREHDERLYATQQISELVMVPESDASRLLFRVNGQGSDVQQIADLMLHRQVNLQAFKQDAILVDNQVIGKFNGPAGGLMSKLCANATGYVEKTVTASITTLGGLKREVMLAVLNNAVSEEMTLEHERMLELAKDEKRLAVAERSKSLRSRFKADAQSVAG